MAKKQASVSAGRKKAIKSGFSQGRAMSKDFSKGKLKVKMPKNKK